ncbi:BamA/TamA family outer membrane protein [Ramlibacter sp. G-1-2-2]|uniref:BamA/TamA family outer membrane protein n=1 Tax=Ramlibacter agri TaxID=2728837 RepID=A0A848H0R4_9BURK|nr:patatin-like phospholipase family protein [Ramlibacter agri]NML43211.1 BamA/TamA family outer membrane protein [Ramlibacter agri]
MKKAVRRRRALLPRTALLAALVAAATQSQAQAQPAGAAEPARPKVCLVLSGGGARGAAHVGVLKVLQELRVPVDCITGTSMGSIVGAAYASGTPVGEMEEVLGQLSTRLLFQEKPPREERAVRLKRDDTTNLAPLEMGLDGRGLQLPQGLVSGVQLETVLRDLAKARGFYRFDDLPIPFRAVATDLVTGKPVVLARGELAAAMRASMSVPGVLQPVRLDDKLLVDGGLTNNLPVDVARAMGADVVIAVNLGTPLSKPEELHSVLGVTGQMVNILTEQNVRASLESLHPEDILVIPRLDNFSAADFDHMTETVPVGEAATRLVADRLARYSVSPEAYAAWEARRVKLKPPDNRPIDEIRFDNLKRVNPLIAKGEMETEAGQPIEQPVLDKDMQRLFGTGDFEHVSYRLLEEPGKRILAVDAVEKAWGPDYLRLGLGLSSDFKGDAFFNLLASYRMTWLNRLGGEWRWDAQVGRASGISTEFYQPLQRGPGLFIAPKAEYWRRTIDVFQGNQRVASYDTNEGRVGLDLGAQFTRYGETRFGYLFTRTSAALDTGLPVLAVDSSYVTQAGWSWRSLVDQLDNVNFPRKGYGASLEFFGARKSLGSDLDFTRGEFSGVYVHSFGEHTFQVAARAGARIGSDPLPPGRQFQWGGLLQQSGYPTGALMGQDLRFGRVVYYNRVRRWALLDGVYAGGSLEVGRVDKPLVPNNQQGTLYSGALFLGVDTPVGPLYLGWGHASRGFNAWYLFLGRP